MSNRVVSACLAAAVGLLGTACSAGAASSTSAARTPTGSAAAVTTSSPQESASPGATDTAASSETATATAAASSPAAAGSACTGFAATHTFLRLAAATENTDGSLTVTGNRATMVCGGPDDYHYDFAAATVTARVVPSATVGVLNTSLHDTPTTHAKFPVYLKTDQNVRVFAYTGSLTAITSLTEQFHP